MKFIAYDTETTGLSYCGSDRMFAYSTCDDSGNINVVRLDRVGGKEKLRALVDSAIRGDIVLCMHNSKFDLAFTEKEYGSRIGERILFHDSQLMSHVLRNDHRGHRLKDLAWELAGIKKDDEAAVRKYARNAEDEDYSKVPESIMKKYQERDAKRTMLLFLFFKQKLEEKPNLWNCYCWERDVVVPTLRMEQRGFMIRIDRTMEIRDWLISDAKDSLDEVEKVYGRRINIGNNNVLRQVLYNEKKMPIIERTATGMPSVDKEVLHQLYEQTHDPLLTLAVRYGSRRRGATMLQSYLDFADSNGVIHPSIKTCGAQTGRESCSDPNLQNVEKEGRLKNPFPTPARKCFRPRPGFVNFHVDYAGIELRLLVHYTKDPELVEEVRKPNGDPHYLAAQIFYPAFTDEERRLYRNFCHENPIIVAGIDAFEKKSKEWNSLRDPSKNTNFAVPYGAGAAKATKTLGLPFDIGKYRFDNYRARFPNLCSFTNTVSKEVKETGGVTDAFGGFLHVIRDKAYSGTNYLIQGTAAKILKRAQVRVHKFLEEKTDGQCGMIIPIHDELVIEWPRKLLHKAKEYWRTIRLLMIDFPQFDVPLDVEVDITTVDWAHKRKFKFLED